MCDHSLARARERAFTAMQFNFVVASNERAVRLWQACGFEIVGRLPAAFRHPRFGDVDAYVMFRRLLSGLGREVMNGTVKENRRPRRNFVDSTQLFSKLSVYAAG